LLVSFFVATRKRQAVEKKRQTHQNLEYQYFVLFFSYDDKKATVKISRDNDIRKFFNYDGFGNIEAVI
jgi:hypothetical protein